jgi:hypothetical protein
VIALVQLVLPSTLLVVPDTLGPLTYEGDTELEGIDKVEVTLLPPYRSQLPDIPKEGLPCVDPDLFVPAEPQPTSDDHTVDGVAAVACDVIAVQIAAPGYEFDRRRGEGASPVAVALRALACDAANGALERIRVLANATHLRLLDPENVLFRLVFLDDAGRVLPKEEERFRQTWNGRTHIQYVAITETTWGQVAALGDYETPPWDELWLDAADLDADIGPSLVLAATAVETRIANALDVLARGRLSDELWTWVKERDGDYTKTPYVADQLDVLLKDLGGRSLKDDNGLWEAGVHLRGARNSFVHEGRPMLGKAPKRELVTREKAGELIRQAREIMDFIEALLPEEERRPRIAREANVQVARYWEIPAPREVDQPGGTDES